MADDQRGHLYVVGFTSGLVKVGFSGHNPLGGNGRVATHAAYGDIFNDPATYKWHSARVGIVKWAEDRALELLREAGRVPCSGREWFRDTTNEELHDMAEQAVREAAIRCGEAQPRRDLTPASDAPRTILAEFDVAEVLEAADVPHIYPRRVYMHNRAWFFVRTDWLTQAAHVLAGKWPHAVVETDARGVRINITNL